MKNLTIIFIVILLVILAVKLKDSFSINIGPKNISTPTNATSTASSGLGTKESSESPVTIAVTPRALEESSTSWDFEIALNTHSEELSADLVAVSELVDDSGKSYKPTSWEGSPPGGHHRQGILKFNSISPRPKSIELKIKNVGGIPERNFKWNL